jgi:hypothetical protein
MPAAQVQRTRIDNGDDEVVVCFQGGHAGVLGLVLPDIRPVLGPGILYEEAVEEVLGR